MIMYGLEITKIGRWGRRELHYKLFVSKRDRTAYLSRYGGTIRYVKASKFIADVQKEKEVI